MEAIEHGQRGVSLLDRMHPIANAEQSELQLLLTIGEASIHTQGDSAPETGRVFARAMTLAKRVGNLRQQFHALAGLRQYYTHRDELQTAQQMGYDLLDLGKQTQDANIQQEAHRGAWAPAV